ncbi:TIGR04222 domain-containing membrane protein [Streptomyces sp. cf386]|uniref:TIGR04222 domain-containing membrane protein n=1 Tax=Streptomyces sp. cf386 TaxID=1761904 RepID=UPI000B89492C|nr:TIGR04222 domain-containing membrane protein [Streptomyces sp. cf386]
MRNPHGEQPSPRERRRFSRTKVPLYEAAFLSGDPRRVADLTPVSMARQQPLLLARTGWATVVDPRGRDEMERSVIRAIGPEGQSRIEPVRDATAAADAVGSLGDRLVSAGLAVPYEARSDVATAIRQVRLAAPVVPALGASALLAPAQSDIPAHLVALWFALPFVLTLSCLAIARIEIHPYAQWASPAGQRLLSALVRRSGAGDDRTYLTSVAVRGVRAIGEPDLRAAFAHREPHHEAFHRRD